ncbi:uncharacterized protein LOC144581707 [Callithrix jacchus]
MRQVSAAFLGLPAQLLHATRRKSTARLAAVGGRDGDCRALESFNSDTHFVQGLLELGCQKTIKAGSTRESQRTSHYFFPSTSKQGAS